MLQTFKHRLLSSFAQLTCSRLPTAVRPSLTTFSKKRSNLKHSTSSLSLSKSFGSSIAMPQPRFTIRVTIQNLKLRTMKKHQTPPIMKRPILKKAKTRKTAQKRRNLKKNHFSQLRRKMSLLLQTNKVTASIEMVTIG